MISKQSTSCKKSVKCCHSAYGQLKLKEKEYPAATSPSSCWYVQQYSFILLSCSTIFLHPVGMFNNIPSSCCHVQQYSFLLLLFLLVHQYFFILSSCSTIFLPSVVLSPCSIIFLHPVVHAPSSTVFSHPLDMSPC